VKNAKKFAVPVLPFVVTGFSPLPAQAAPWSGDVAIGYLATTGNSETSSLNGKSSVVYAHDDWKNTLAVSAVNTYADGQSSAENYLAAEQLEYNFTMRDYAFGAVDWNKDLFAAIRESTSETAGYGRHLLIGPRHFLDAELGVGARQQQTNDVPRERQNEFIGRGALKYRWAITDTTSFQQSLKVASGQSNTYTEAVSALKLQIIGNLFTNLSYTIKNNTQSAPDTEKTDTEAAVTISYEFGKAKS
jgi:putative salt-induced outer membrane protein